MYFTVTFSLLFIRTSKQKPEKSALILNVLIGVPRPSTQRSHVCARRSAHKRSPMAIRNKWSGIHTSTLLFITWWIFLNSLIKNNPLISGLHYSGSTLRPTVIIKTNPVSWEIWRNFLIVWTTSWLTGRLDTKLWEGSVSFAVWLEILIYLKKKK